MKKRHLVLLVIGFGGCSAWADDVVVDISLATSDGNGASVGNIIASDVKGGLLLTPKLTGLTPGIHAIHLHENPDCGPGEKDGKKMAALKAGGHFDPQKTGKHRGPYHDDGHRGDLPPLYVDKDGSSTTPVFAPSLTVNMLTGHALVIHAGGDNFSDTPAKLGGGGGGERIACGAIENK